MRSLVWLNKSLLVVFNCTFAVNFSPMNTDSISSIKENRVTIANTELVVDSRKNGDQHFVYVFQPGQIITLSNHPPLDSSQVILRKVSMLVTPGRGRKPLDFQKEAEKAYRDLVNKHVRVPKCYWATSNGWLLEKMKVEVLPEHWKEVTTVDELSLQDKKILKFAKKILTENALAFKNGTDEFVGDFYPRNVMLNDRDKPYVIDFAYCKKSKHNLFPSLKAWANTNCVVFEYLTKGFPESVKDVMTDRWNQATS